MERCNDPVVKVALVIIAIALLIIALNPWIAPKRAQAYDQQLIKVEEPVPIYTVHWPYSKYRYAEIDGGSLRVKCDTR